MLTPAQVDELYNYIDSSPFHLVYKQSPWYLEPWTLDEDAVQKIYAYIDEDKRFVVDTVRDISNENPEVALKVYGLERSHTLHAQDYLEEQDHGERAVQLETLLKDIDTL